MCYPHFPKARTPQNTIDQGGGTRSEQNELGFGIGGWDGGRVGEWMRVHEGMRLVEPRAERASCSLSPGVSVVVPAEAEQRQADRRRGSAPGRQR
eukprot:1326487-Rhodomonas_salina.2